MGRQKPNYKTNFLTESKNNLQVKYDMRVITVHILLLLLYVKTTYWIGKKLTFIIFYFKLYVWMTCGRALNEI